MRLPSWKITAMIVTASMLCGGTAFFLMARPWSRPLQPPVMSFIAGNALPLVGIIRRPVQDQISLQTTNSSSVTHSTAQHPTMAKTTPAPTSTLIGIYESISPHDPASLDRLEQIRQAGFNTVLNYDILDGSRDEITRYLDKAQALGLHIIFSIKDFYDQENNPDINLADFAEYGTTNDEIALGIVNAYKYHPAIYSWYISDEKPESPQDTSWTPILQQRYRRIKQADPQHPTMIVLGCYQGENVAAWPAALQPLTPATDQIGFDSYPVPYAPLDVVSRCAHTLSIAVPSPADRWFVVQAFSWASYPDTVKSDQEDVTQARYPTVDELTSMIKSAQQNGVRNVMFYSFFDLKNDTTNFSQSWSNLQQALRNTGIVNK